MGLREETLGPGPVDEGGAVAWQECLVVAEQVNDSRGFDLGQDIRAYALAYQLKRSGELDSALLPVTPGDPVIDASRRAVQFSVSKRGGLADVVASAAKSSVVLREKLQERYR
jgi:hypothetical protein